MGPHLAYHVSKLNNFTEKNCFLFEKYEFKMFSLTCLVTKIIQAFHSHNRVCKKAYKLYELKKKWFSYHNFFPLFFLLLSCLAQLFPCNWIWGGLDYNNFVC